ncbi:LacI family DNA-binding transcriptional regulator, partial [Streptomyces sp. NPDC053813]|uniref:LacI family DNA-binding transcriptional regulator n=1 Tax=Streptomyces sp. NPDC053813 TaxID=3365717 RepID=UPI0037CF9871
MTSVRWFRGSRKPQGGGPYMASIKDVAAQAGVSVATVSRVLNSHPSVSPDAGGGGGEGRPPPPTPPPPPPPARPPPPTRTHP